MPKARAGPCSPLLACCSCREEEVGVSTAGIPTPTPAVPGAGALILQHMAVLGQLAGAQHQPLLAGLRPTGGTAVRRGSEARAASQGSVTEVAFPRVPGGDPGAFGSLLKAAGTCDGLQDGQG